MIVVISFKFFYYQQNYTYQFTNFIDNILVCWNLPNKKIISLLSVLIKNILIKNYLLDSALHLTPFTQCFFEKQ